MPEEYQKLPIAEKLRLVEQLWDDIALSDEPFPIQSCHKEEAARRAADLDANPEFALTREQLGNALTNCMARRLEFHPEVASDLRRAIHWYDAVSIGLGDRFRMWVNAQFDFIESNPEIYPKVFDDVRFATIRRFPYLVLFREDAARVTILGVFPGASNPQRWRERAR